jgi:hypothetical protein
MRDAHDILKQITAPEDLQEDYEMILEDFRRRPISMTLIDVKSLSLSN